jgi:DNA-binding SARP family transcriptional activator
VLEHKLDEPRRLRKLRRLTGEIAFLDAAGATRAAREMEAGSGLDKRVVRLLQTPGAEARQRAEHTVSQELHRVGGEEERHLVPGFRRRPPDEKREGSPRRVLRSPRDVDQELRHAAIVGGSRWVYLAGTLAARVQICGRVAVAVEGRRVEAGLPGRQGLLLFVFLACNRLRPASRDELMHALWPRELPPTADSSLSALLSRLRHVVPLAGRSEIRLDLAEPVFVDFEAALEAIHRAESAVRRGVFTDGWGPARVALHTADRGFLQDVDVPWAVERRRVLEDVLLRAHECVARIGIGLAGPELDSARRSSRALIRLAPLRESGYRLLMEALHADGNDAEALTVYDRLRVLLRDELGTSPSTPTQELHRALLG